MIYGKNDIWKRDKNKPTLLPSKRLVLLYLRMKQETKCRTI